MLLFSCLCLIASTILLSLGANIMYQISIYRNNTDLAELLPAKMVIDATTKVQHYTYTFGSLIWATIFLVKFSYLAFFRSLIDRQHRMLIYWRVASIVTFLAGVFDISSPFIGCAQFGNDSIQCSNKYYMKRLLAVEGATIALDIITDLMILSLPVYLLYKVRIKPKQKIGVGSFLCLSIFMIIIAIIRISRVHAADFEIWACFWQQLEGCVAVLMVSLTAFRTLFVSKHSSSSDQRKPKLSDTYRRRLWFSKKSSQSENEKAHVSVPIPGATMTGLRTFIRGEPGTDTNLTESSLDSIDCAKGGNDIIHVTHDLEVGSDRTDPV